MDVILDRKQVVRALDQLTRITAHSARPVLTGVRIVAASDAVTLAATDTQQTMVTRVPAQVLQPGTCVLPGRYLRDLVRRLPGSQVRLRSTADPLAAEVLAGVSAATVQGFAPDQYPRIPDFPAAATITLPSAILQDAIESTAYAAAVRDARPLLTGVLLEASGSQFQALATDGFRVGLYHTELPLSSPLRCVVPATALAHVLRILKDGPVCEVATRGDEVFFQVGQTFLAARVVEGDYPKVLDMIPRNYPVHCTVPAADLMTALEGVVAAAEDRRLYPTTVALKHQTLVLRAEGPSGGSATATIATAYTGEPFRVCFNARLLLEGLRHLRGAEYVLEFSGERSIAWFRSVSEPNLVYMQMPLSE